MAHIVYEHSPALTLDIFISEWFNWFQFTYRKLVQISTICDFPSLSGFLACFICQLMYGAKFVVFCNYFSLGVISIHRIYLHILKLTVLSVLYVRFSFHCSYYFLHFTSTMRTILVINKQVRLTAGM